MKTLIMMVGLPRSGKTTRARQLSDAHKAPVVNPDSIRLALHGSPYIGSAEQFVWAIARTMVEALFYQHDVVILDACNNSRARRDAWESPRWARRFVELDTDVQTCIERANDNDTLVDVIKRMASRRQWIEADEIAEKLE